MNNAIWYAKNAICAKMPFEEKKNLPTVVVVVVGKGGGGETLTSHTLLPPPPARSLALPLPLPCWKILATPGHW